MNLTPRQLDVIVAIRNYRHIHGYAPTMQELADQLGTSKVTIFEHVGAWRRSGFFAGTNTRPAHWKSFLRKSCRTKIARPSCRLLGKSPPARPSKPLKTAKSWIWSRCSIPATGVYVLRVRGESMIEDHLCDGDYVVIERRENARNGEQVVALLDTGEATLRGSIARGVKFVFSPPNSTMEPRMVDADRCRIQGVVIGVLRSYN